MKAYLYLAKRNKKGTKLLARLEVPNAIISRIEDIKTLNLHPNLESKIDEVIKANKIHWELWIETADSYEKLKKELNKRGYSEIAIHPVPMFNNILPLTPNLNKIKKPPKSMIQRGKR
jgi:hypothetical protein